MTQEALNEAIDKIDFSKMVVNSHHGYMLILDGKPFMSSDNKILFNTKSTLQANFRYKLKKMTYDIMLENGEVPLNNNSYGYNVDGISYISPWGMYDTPLFKRRYKQIANALRSSGRMKIQYI